MLIYLGTEECCRDSQLMNY